METVEALCVRNLPKGGFTEMEVYELKIIWENGEMSYLIEQDSGLKLRIDALTFEKHFVEDW